MNGCQGLRGQNVLERVRDISSATDALIALRTRKEVICKQLSGIPALQTELECIERMLAAAGA